MKNKNHRAGLYFCHECSHQWMTVASTTPRCTRCFNTNFIEEVETDLDPSIRVRNYFCYKCLVRWSSPTEHIVKCPKNKCSNDSIEIVPDNFVPPKNSTEFRRISQIVPQKDLNIPSTSSQIIRKTPGRASAQKKGKKTPKKSTINGNKKKSKTCSVDKNFELSSDSDSESSDSNSTSSDSDEACSESDYSIGFVERYFGISLNLASTSTQSQANKNARAELNKQNASKRPVNQFDKNQRRNKSVEIVPDNFVPPKNSTELRKSSRNVSQKDTNISTTSGQITRKKPGRACAQKKGKKTPRDETSSDSDKPSSESDDDDFEPQSTSNQSGAKVQIKNASQALNEQNGTPGNFVRRSGRIVAQKDPITPSASRKNPGRASTQKKGKKTPKKSTQSGIKKNSKRCGNFFISVDHLKQELEDEDEISFEPPSISTQLGAIKNENQALSEQKFSGNQIDESQNGNGTISEDAINQIVESFSTKNNKIPSYQACLKEYCKALLLSQQNGSSIQNEIFDVDEIVPAAEENAALTQDLNENSASNEEPLNDFKEDEEISFELTCTSTQSGAKVQTKYESQALDEQKASESPGDQNEENIEGNATISNDAENQLKISLVENAALTQVLDLREKTASNEEPANISKQDEVAEELNETFVDAPTYSKNLNDNILNSTMISPQKENEKVCDKQGESQDEYEAMPQDENESQNENETQTENEVMDTNEREDSELDVHENCAPNQTFSNGSEMSLKFETIIKDGRRYMLVPIFNNVDANQNSVGFLPQPSINDQHKSVRLSLIQPQTTIKKRKRQTQLSPFGNKIYRTKKRFKEVKDIDDENSQRIPITPSSSSVADTYESDENI